MEARCTGRKARGWRRLAAYGSSGLEDGAQDGDLEKRHMLSVRTSRRYRGVSAIGGWWAGGWWAQGEDCGQYRPRVGAVFALVRRCRCLSGSATTTLQWGLKLAGGRPKPCC